MLGSLLLPTLGHDLAASRTHPCAVVVSESIFHTPYSVKMYYALYVVSTIVVHTPCIYTVVSCEFLKSEKPKVYDAGIAGKGLRAAEALEGELWEDVGIVTWPVRRALLPMGSVFSCRRLRYGHGAGLV